MSRNTTRANSKAQEQTYFLVYKGVKENAEHSVEVEIKPFGEELEYLQSLVGGYLEHFIIDRHLDDLHIDMWIDEEGKFKTDQYKATWSLCDHDGTVYDVIFGNCVFSKYNDEGETLGLTQDEVNIVIQFLLDCPRAYIEFKDTHKKINSVLVKHVNS